jgi:hypothetical protein
MFPTQMDDRACRAMACDLEEPEAPQKPAPAPVRKPPEVLLAARDKEIAVLREELAARKGKHSQELLALEERCAERGMAIDRLTRQLAEADKGRAMLGVEVKDLHRRLEEREKRHESLPAAEPVNVHDFEGLVLGGPCHGERWRCTGRYLTVPRSDGPDVRYALRPIYTERGKVECWLPEGADSVAVILSLAARPNAKPELPGRALTEALADMAAFRAQYLLQHPDQRPAPMVEDPPRKRCEEQVAALYGAGPQARRTVTKVHPVVEKGAVRIECEHGYDHCPKCDDDGA